MQLKKSISLFVVFVIFFLGINPEKLFASELEVTIRGFIYNEDSTEVFDNFPVIIYPDITDSTKKYTVYTNSNGYYFLTFLANTENNALVKIRSNCNNQWVNTIDTVRLVSEILYRNYYICHNPYWYMQEMIVSGTVTSLADGSSIENHKIIINNNKYSNFSFIVFTNKNGFYCDTISYNVLDTAKYTVSTYSLCNRTFEILTHTFIPSSQVLNFDFEVCTDTSHNWDIAFFYKTYPSTNKIYFQQISNTEVDSVHWNFGDNTTGYGEEITHFYEHGSYKITMTSFLNGQSKKYTKRIIIGNNTSSVSGNVYASGVAIDSGYVIAYHSSKAAFSIMNVTKINNGVFSFENNLLRGEYLLYAIPTFDIDTLFFPKYIATYNSGNYHWTNATTITVDENSKNIDIELLKYDQIYYGNCNIEFSVSSDIIFKHDVANVLLFNNSGEVINSIPLINTKKVSFSNLPEGFYTVQVEAPGVISKPAGFYISENNTPSINFFINNYNNIDYYVTDLTSIYSDNVSIFPNPFADFITINAPVYPSNVSIYDIQGEIVHEQQITINETISLSKLSAGVYITIIENNKKVIARKIIIKN